eukprot:TRINITY_DN8834_c0_g1_i1.p1 TRINITY_DN8834_c0_g1~~TRINITY_DN8834_c0_g1_i1.p1  ORF type:complete len:943 (-),score=270.64 TRINITY_DN8834_c0_g1_i1:315-2738(-)
MDETEDDEVKELISFLENLSSVKFPLKVNGVKPEEVDASGQEEFAELLDEASKSLKRTLTFVGGIVRGYLRRGHKNDKWVKMIRRLESRFENDTSHSNAEEITSTPRQLRQSVSAYNKVWKVLGDMWKYIDNQGLRHELVKSLNSYYQMYASYIEFYLPQIINILVSVKGLKDLEHFILNKCRYSQHFAIQCVFLLKAMGDHGPKHWIKRCRKFLKKIEIHIPTEEELDEVVFSQGVSVSPKKKKAEAREHAAGVPRPTSSIHTRLWAEAQEVVDLDSPDGSAPNSPRASHAQTHQPQTNSTAQNDGGPGGVDGAVPIAKSGKEPEKEDERSSVGTSPSLQGHSVLGSSVDNLHAHSHPKYPNIPKAERRLNKDYFFSQIQFMEELVAISDKLAQKFDQPESYVPELKRLLEEQEEKYVMPGTAYVPYLATKRQRVLRIVYDETFPIPTYGRVLFYLMLEVVSVPAMCTPEMANELITLKEESKEKEKGEGGEEEDNAQEDDSEETDKEKDDGTGRNEGRTGAFGELWPHKRARLKKSSIYGHVDGWDARAYIVKHGDFVLQEQFVMQLIMQFQNIFEEEGTSIKLRTYDILALSSDAGLIEVVPNALSIDKLKSKSENFTTLADFFKKEWSTPEAYNSARSNFVRSVAGYCLVCYFLQIKDRHNGNIMLASDGTLLHIDFGYLLARTIKFEKAPFKLTEEFIEVMGGEKSKLFKQFVDLMVEGFLAVRLHYEKLLLLVEMSLTSTNEQFIPCLEKDSVIRNLRKRFRLEWNTPQIRELVLNLIAEARDNWRTTIYDTYQRILNDIY